MQIYLPFPVQEGQGIGPLLPEPPQKWHTKEPVPPHFGHLVLLLPPDEF